MSLTSYLIYPLENLHRPTPCRFLAVAVDSEPYTERKNFKDMLLSAGKSGSRNPCRISGDRDYEWMQSAEASNIYVKIFTHRARVWVWVLVLGLGLDFGWVWVWV
tara:strand:+ start:37 stop:351 length:315 start_codon:yes stop_codon:yes gene_type:complete